MNANDKTEFAKVWATVANLYGKNISAQLLTLTFEVLRPYSLKQIKSGLSTHIRSTQGGAFFPKPADIIQYISGNVEQKAEQAWGDVVTAIRRTGAWGKPQFEDPLIGKILSRFGDWKQLCHTHQTQLESKKRSFIQHYTFLSENLPKPIESKPVDGLNNSQLNGQSVQTKYIPLSNGNDYIVQIKQSTSETKH